MADTNMQTPCQLCGSDGVMDAIKQHLSISPGQTTKDGLFTFTEVECLGACVNGPMLQINDDYYEDLTPESTTTLLKALQAANATVGDGSASKSHLHSESRAPGAKGVTLPRPGPQSGRESCEPRTGLTSLTSEPWGNETLRKDGALG